MSRKVSVAFSDEIEKETSQHLDEDFEDAKTFSELRYRKLPKVQPSRGYKPKLVRVSVYKARNFWRLSDIRSTYSENDNSSKDPISSTKLGSMSSRGGPLGYTGEKDKHSNNSMSQHMFLNESTIAPERLTVCTNATQELITPRSSVYIRRPTQESETFKAQLLASQKKESHCLSLHTKVKQEQLRQENDMMTKSGKNRENLLLRRHQLMPKISSNSLERSAVPVERSVTPKKFPDWVLWAPIIYDVKEKKGIRPQMTKPQRGYDVVTDWVGHPEITDEIRKELDLNREHIMSNLVPNTTEHVCAQEMQCRCLPTFPRLGVLGFNYNKIQHNLRQPIRKLIVLGNDQQTKSTENIIQSPVLKDECPNESNEAKSPSMVSLTLGHVHLFWSTDPQRRNKTCVVELGCSAELNKHSIDYVLMRNTGTTVIRFSWIKKDTRDTFQKHKDEQMRMIFDSVEGVILPGEQYRIPFMYKALTTGQFCEDWNLLTQPVMENGAEVILRLWGFTRLPDEHISTRERIDDILKHKMAISIAKHIVHKLVNTLPLGESTFYDALINLSQLKGPDLFVYNNPWLYYNSYHVDRLGKLAKFIENESKKQQKPAMSMSDIEPSIDGSVALISTNHDPKQPVGSVSMGGTEQSQLDLQKDESSIMSDEDLGSLSGEIRVLRKGLFVAFKPPELPPKPVVLHKKKKDNDIDAESASKFSVINQSQDNVSKEMTLSQDSIEKSHSDVGQIKTHDSVVNTIDPNIVVHSIRQDLIQCRANRIRQDALFTLVSEELSVLLFRPFHPCENWKIPVVNGFFSKAMQDFETYAAMLEETCYEAQYLMQAPMEINEKRSVQSSFHSDLTSEYTSIPSIKPSGITPSTLARPLSIAQAGTTAEEESVSQEDDGRPRPRFGLEPERYKNQYYGRLYTRMYWLLSDICEKMDILVYQPRQIDKSYGKEIFIKVGKVPLNIDIKNQLVRPLPPKWVNILHKMNNVRRQFYNESNMGLFQTDNVPLSE